VTARVLSKGVETFHSLGRVRFLVLFTFGVFLTLIMMVASLVQDLLDQEFAEFDAVTSFVVHIVFDEDWASWMNVFTYLASFQVLLPIAALTLVWILKKGKDRMLEAGFLLFVLIGGELWDEGLRRFFHRAGPGNLPNTFPSEQTFITIIFLGFAGYLLVRHLEMRWVRTGTLLLVLAVSVLVGVSHIYFNLQYPSDVVAGYVFGGVWLSLNIVLLEIFRLFRHNKIRQKEAVSRK
jgi:membrane-associated phospholipid phosphatase